MALLAIDTSSSVCVLGIREGENTWVDEAELGRSHSQEILPRIEALFERSGVDKSSLNAIVYGRGPGSFTGLRIGVGVVQGLAYGLAIPVVGVSSLACLANQVVRPGQGALIALSARNTEVYFGAYRATDTGLNLVGHEGVFEAAEIPSQSGDVEWIGIGDGWALADSLQAASRVDVSEVYLDLKLKALDLIELGEVALSNGEKKTAMEALPEYLREKVAALPGKK